MNLAGGIGMALVLAASGCGSGGAAKVEGGAAGCPPGASGGGTISWLDDGTPECAVSATATFLNTSQYTRFSLTGDATPLGITLGVSTVLAPGPIGGTYSCAPLDSVSVTFLYKQGQNQIGTASCALTLNMQGTAGVHATGTFSATFTPWTTDGGTKSLTNGAFDVPVTITGG